jgi:hypothetical protein
MQTPCGKKNGRIAWNYEPIRRRKRTGTTDAKKGILLDGTGLIGEDRNN